MTEGKIMGFWYEGKGQQGDRAPTKGSGGGVKSL